MKATGIDVAIGSHTGCQKVATRPRKVADKQFSNTKHTADATHWRLRSPVARAPRSLRPRRRPERGGDPARGGDRPRDPPSGAGEFDMVVSGSEYRFRTEAPADAARWVELLNRVREA